MEKVKTIKGKLLSNLINCKFVLILVFLFISIICNSQIKNFKRDTINIYKNEIGIDIENILTFLSKNQQSYLFNCKRYIFNSNALRFGLNLDLSSIRENNLYLKTRFGYEFGEQFYKWRLFYGSDLSFSFSKSNLQPNRHYYFGVEPLIGTKYYFSKHFSVSTEIKLNFFYYIYRNSESFDPASNGENWQICIGSVGMLLFNFHF
jgi:hypothetical protein